MLELVFKIHYKIFSIGNIFVRLLLHNKSLINILTSLFGMLCKDIFQILSILLVYFFTSYKFFNFGKKEPIWYIVYLILVENSRLHIVSLLDPVSDLLLTFWLLLHKLYRSLDDTIRSCMCLSSSINLIHLILVHNFETWITYARYINTHEHTYTHTLVHTYAYRKCWSIQTRFCVQVYVTCRTSTNT